MSLPAKQSSSLPTYESQKSDHVPADLVGRGWRFETITRQLRTAHLLESLRSLSGRLSLASGLRFQSRTRRLQIRESVQLGEKRFVAILRVDGDEFLLGGGASGLSILGQLQAEPVAESFTAVLGQHLAQGEGA